MFKLLGFCLLSCCLISCSGCSSTKSTSSEPLSPVFQESEAGAGEETSQRDFTLTPANQVVKGDSFEFTLPADWEVEASDPLIKSVLINKEKQGLVMMEVFPVNVSTDEFALLVIRRLKQDSVEVKNSNTVNINGQDFVTFDADLDGLTAYMWLTVKNDLGYQFSCGAKTLDVEDLCISFADTLEIR